MHLTIHQILSSFHRFEEMIISFWGHQFLRRNQTGEWKPKNAHLYVQKDKLINAYSMPSIIAIPHTLYFL